ncbi:putative ATP-dependent RNA helicase DDX58 [Trichinella pseudospiralis]|uniref:Putative ATP-dependent RNA helicase DDX58 n=1 Tax=Trichinella pseudospiralis TaxID=6337 RepID=A0A0V1IC57_TRIPS|nr:putative ATP-dependent RNA helicase DDX58 [Trichinella pseudospiralis]
MDITSLIESLNEITTQKKTLSLYDFQEELVAPALLGKNTLICSPTGTGKTYMLLKVILNHIKHHELTHEKYKVSRRVFVKFVMHFFIGMLFNKICLIVPTVVLAEQHLSLLEEYISDVHYLGNNESGSSTFISARDNELLICTAQTLLNVLNYSAEESFSLNIGSFTLLLFDECHHAADCHPYNALMDFYFRARGPVPQIVGATASVCFGSASTLPQTITKVLNICCNLDCCALSAADPESEKLKRYISKNSELSLILPDPIPNATFLKDLVHILDTLETSFTTLIERLDRSAISVTSLARLQDKMRPTYRSELGQLKQAVVTVKDPVMRRNAISYLNALLHTHESLDIAVHTSFSLGFSHFVNNYTYHFENLSQADSIFYQIQQRKVQALEGELVRAYKSPLYEALKKIVLNQFSLDPNSRVLIFVRTKKLAAQLCQCIKDDSDVETYGVNFITSSGNSTTDRSGSKVIIASRLRQFKEGEMKILIATSLLEEGVDVAACNLVIRYNYVTSVISKIQQRGRSRKENGAVVLLAYKGLYSRKEKTLEMQEALLLEAVRKIKLNGNIWFQNELSKLKAKRNLITFPPKILHGCNSLLTDSKIFCRTCDNYFAPASSLRHVNQTLVVCVDRDAFRKLWPSEAFRLEPDIVLYCNHCRCKVGQMLKQINANVVCFSVKSVLFSFGEANERKAFAKWSKARLSLPPLLELRISDLQDFD